MRTKEYRAKQSQSHKGKVSSIETRNKISKYQKDRPKSASFIFLMSQRKGSKNPNWKGGISKGDILIRQSLEYRLWREAVFARDNFTCQKCGKRGVNLIAHHILNFAQYIELRFAIDNGIAFCKDDHRKFHQKFGKRNNTQEQVALYLMV